MTSGSMLVVFQCFTLCLLLRQVCSDEERSARHKRWLVFPPATQYGALLTISTPIDPHVSFAYFFEANYYTIANVTWLGMLLGNDMLLNARRSRRDAFEYEDSSDKESIYSEKESIDSDKESIYSYKDSEDSDKNKGDEESGDEDWGAEEPVGGISRALIYTSLEKTLEAPLLVSRSGLSGRSCLLRAICENSNHHFHHNGLLGDLLHILLTPSSSQPEEDVSDEYYTAELLGRRGTCAVYSAECPRSILDSISLPAT